MLVTTWATANRRLPLQVIQARKSSELFGSCSAPPALWYLPLRNGWKLTWVNKGRTAAGKQEVASSLIKARINGGASPGIYARWRRQPGTRASPVICGAVISRVLGAIVRYTQNHSSAIPFVTI